MHVVATAGHVDHGKSTLVQALTGQQPDRWDEERRRGLTIDLGYVWTTLPSGETVAFVDVPGHRRFIGNMLAGLGPAPAVIFVVAADEGWSAQSTEHLAAVEALGVENGLLVITKADLADPAIAVEEAHGHLARSSLGAIPHVTVSARTGQGLDDVRTALDALVSRLPRPRADGRVRLWVDRAFTMKGSGTVVTGTLGRGTLRVGDQLAVANGASDGPAVLAVRGLQSMEQLRQDVPAVARVAVNLRGVTPAAVARGSALVTPGSWRETRQVDVRLLPLKSIGPDSTPTQADPHGDLVIHVGTAAVGVLLRPLDGDVARLRLQHALPLQAGDRAILRDPAAQRVLAGVLVLDVDPPELARRGDASRRASALANAAGRADVSTEVSRRGAVRASDLEALGIPSGELGRAAEVRRVGDWLVGEAQWRQWVELLAAVVDAHAAAHPLDPRLPIEAARHDLGVPDGALLTALAPAAGLEVGEGRLGRPGAVPDLGAAEAGLRQLEARLAAAPFDAPERPDLERWGLGVRQLAAAEHAGRVVRLPDDVVLLPKGPAMAMRVLAGLPQPFTTSEARQALGTTRRVAIPLLEHLDRRGWTRRIDAGHREVVR
ncbi:MAG TPA: selenocysteine-specific translation elongation factor [Segeticoccus sp.]|nr:selenocysteine-specific translation elongation factor [Segeticoccus sp.]HET8599823.1 selenocysteine-specific translation elongation factor [Segeticoccus sp.]